MADSISVASTSAALMDSMTVVEAPRKIKRRPARKQQEAEKKALEMTGQTYNSWYHKWAGGDRYDSYNAKEHSQTRCVIESDMGYTRADTSGNKYCCLYFARGCCPKGVDCTYLHRLPLPDTVLPDASLDVFGREKHADYRDDMGGVGSFGRQNRTLYVGKMKVTNSMELSLLRHFEEWGDIERIKILQTRGVGFVTYFSELSAQFAKEAMMNQSLDDEEILNVRWATEDPNPKAKVYEYERLVELGHKGIGARLTDDFVAAVRKMDELEGLVEALPAEYGPDDVRSLPAGEKRLAVEAGPTSNTSFTDEPSGKRQRIQQQAPVTTGITPSVAPPSNGLLSAAALTSLKKAAALKRAKLQKTAASSATTSTAPPAVMST